MAKTARNPQERAEFRSAHSFLVKAAKLLAAKHPRLSEVMLEEIESWSPNYFTPEAIAARRLLRKAGGTIPLATPGYRKPKLAGLDRAIAGETTASPTSANN